MPKRDKIVHKKIVQQDRNKKNCKNLKNKKELLERDEKKWKIHKKSFEDELADKQCRLNEVGGSFHF